FEGLSAIDPEHDGTAFYQGEYAASEALFRKRIKRARGGFEVLVVPGFFDRSLTREARERCRLERAAFVTIDCDLHAPALAALEFVTPLLATGSVLFFDDWYYASGDMRRGEAGACAAWLRAHPDVGLV